MDNFLYCTNEELNSITRVRGSFLVPRGLEDAFTLWQAYVLHFHFMDGFGYNWNAFNDCVCSYEDFPDLNIMIIHEDLPLRSSPEDQRIYLSVLNDSIDFWQRSDNSEFHSVKVYFPESCRSEIAKVLDP